MATIVIGVSMAIYHMWVIAFGAPEAIMLRGTHLLFALTLVFLFYRRIAAAEGSPPSALDYALIVIGASPILYLFVYYDYIINRIFYIDDLSTADMVFGIVLIAIIIEATRRVIGWALPITALVFLGYGLFAARLAPDQIIDQLYMTTEGIFGIPIAVSATYVVIFVLFGSFLERTGIGHLIMDFAMALTGHTAGGPGKVSVVSSSLFGTVSGSAVANVMVDGPIFVIWAIIPAFLYYVACFSAVHFEAKRRGLEGLKRSELPVMTRVLAERGHLFLPLVIILVVMYAGYSAPMAALAGVLSCFPVAALRKSTRHNVTFLNVIDALHDGARNSLTVACACACAGIVIGIVTLSGLGIVFTQFVVHLSKDTLLLALILTMFAGIVLGMGMPTTPAYIIMTALLVPALIKLGVVVPAAHMFAFYFAILSAITPPVALAVYAAAGLAKSDIWLSGWAAVRIGAAGFIVPFMFVYEPALLMIGDWPTVIWAVLTATVGVMIFAAGLHGYLLTKSALWQSVLLTGAGLLLIHPGFATSALGAAIALAIGAMQWLSRRAARTAVRPAQ
jgi:TRAP-type uncharacterized transport system fused permease subunit